MINYTDVCPFYFFSCRYYGFVLELSILDVRTDRHYWYERTDNTTFLDQSFMWGWGERIVNILNKVESG